MEELQRRVAATKTGYESAAAKLAEKRACLVECEREHSALAAEKSELQSKLGEAAAERKRVTHQCATLEHAVVMLQLPRQYAKFDSGRHLSLQVKPASKRNGSR